MGVVANNVQITDDSRGMALSRRASVPPTERLLTLAINPSTRRRAPSLLRYEDDGTLDATFGLGGMAVTTLAATGRPSAVTLQADRRSWSPERSAPATPTGLRAVVTYMEVDYDQKTKVHSVRAMIP